MARSSLTGAPGSSPVPPQRGQVMTDLRGLPPLAPLRTEAAALGLLVLAPSNLSGLSIDVRCLSNEPASSSNKSHAPDLFPSRMRCLISRTSSQTFVLMV